MSEVEEILSRIKTHKSVQGIIVINKDAAIIRTTYTGDKQEEGEQLAKAIHQLVVKAKSAVRELNKEDELKFLRVRSKKNEIMVAPEKDFILIVVQGPKIDSKDETD